MTRTLKDAAVRAWIRLNDRGIPVSAESVAAVDRAIQRQFTAWPAAGWATRITVDDVKVIGYRASSIVLQEHGPA